MNLLFVLMLISLASANSANIEPSGLSCRQAQCQCEELSKRVEALEEILSPPKMVGQDCADLYDKGYRKDGVYAVNPDGTGQFKVYCDQTTNGGGWTIFQRRLDGSVDFYRGWDEYVSGFGDVRGEYWLGLEKVNRLTRKRSFRLRVDMEDTKGITKYAEYERFSILGEQTKYKLSIGKYSGNAGDSLTGHNNAAFSTKDKDNDAHAPGSCAIAYKGAWWYKACHSSNLNGFYYYGAHKSYADGVEWHAWKGYHYSLKRTEMKFRPMGF